MMNEVDLPVYLFYVDDILLQGNVKASERKARPIPERLKRKKWITVASILKRLTKNVDYGLFAHH